MFLCCKSHLFFIFIFYFFLKKGTIYLTFNDGPNEGTPLVLDVLKQYNVRLDCFEDVKCIFKENLKVSFVIAIEYVFRSFVVGELFSSMALI